MFRSSKTGKTILSENQSECRSRKLTTGCRNIIESMLHVDNNSSSVVDDLLLSCTETFQLAFCDCSGNRAGCFQTCTCSPQRSSFVLAEVGFDGLTSSSSKIRSLSWPVLFSLFPRLLKFLNRLKMAMRSWAMEDFLVCRLTFSSNSCWILCLKVADYKMSFPLNCKINVKNPYFLFLEWWKDAIRFGQTEHNYKINNLNIHFSN